MSTEYIHYGCDAYDPEQFVEPVNQHHHNKPDGGLWGSPVDAEYPWVRWCQENDFTTGPMDKSFRFKLVPGAKVYHVRSRRDVELMPQKCFSEFLREIDFEEMLIDGWDAIEYEVNGETYMALYGWDCDCILVLNRNVILPLT